MSSNLKIFALKNGLTILLEENHAAPVISFNVLVKVGSADESDKDAGMAHVIEHMLFKGTPTRPVGAIASEVEACGGEINAYTSFDQTVYYINMANRYADKGLEILADAVKNPIFDNKEFGKEKEVVLEEISRGKDDPHRTVSNNLFNKAYKLHTYGRPIIGFEKTVKSFTRNDLIRFYKNWYVPNNMVIGIVGDFEEKALLKKIEKAFGDLKPKKLPLRNRKKDPAQNELRSIVNSSDIQTNYFTMGFHIPEIVHEDVPALDIISHVLAGSESSRLEQIIKEKKKLATNIYCYAFTPKDPGLFMVGAEASTKNLTKAVEAIWHELQNIKEEPITSEELELAKLNIRSHEIYEKETVGGQASKHIYFMATANNPNFEKTYYQALGDIQIDDIRTVAQKYLIREKATISLMQPSKDSKSNIGSEICNTIKSSKKVSKTKQKEVKTHIAPPKRYILSNGLTLIIRENHTLPIVSICAATLSGTRMETPQNNGINSLIAQTLTKGTKTRSAHQIATEMETIAGQVGGFTGRNTLGLRGDFISNYLEKGFDLFADVLCNPIFDKKEVAKEKLFQLESIKNQEDSLGTTCIVQMLKKLYKNHPYGLRVLGERKSISKLTEKTISDYYRKVMTAPNMVVSVSGDISPKEIRKLAEQKFKKLPLKKFHYKKIPAPHSPTKIEEVVLKKQKMQAHIALGFLGTTLNNPDYYPLMILNHIL
ncbi:insulinase family protein, partial [bacterium]|nr:insulinase family protein [bacterium]